MPGGGSEGRLAARLLSEDWLITPTPGAASTLSVLCVGATKGNKGK